MLRCLHFDLSASLLQTRVGFGFALISRSLRLGDATLNFDLVLRFRLGDRDLLLGTRRRLSSVLACLSDASATLIRLIINLRGRHARFVRLLLRFLMCVGRLLLGLALGFRYVALRLSQFLIGISFRLRNILTRFGLSFGCILLQFCSGPRLWLLTTSDQTKGCKRYQSR